MTIEWSKPFLMTLINTRILGTRVSLKITCVSRDSFVAVECAAISVHFSTVSMCGPANAKQRLFILLSIGWVLACDWQALDSL
jgi:hypothetical protein